MNKGRPDWAAKAENNEVGKQLGEVSHPTPTQAEAPKTKKKVGRKKALLSRKKVMCAFTEYQLGRFAIAEGLIKANGVKLSRSRSETLELGAALLNVMLQSDEHRAFALSVINDWHEYEEKNLLRDSE